MPHESRCSRIDVPRWSLPAIGRVLTMLLIPACSLTTLHNGDPAATTTGEGDDGEGDDDTGSNHGPILPGDGGVPAGGVVRYPAGRVHAPMTADFIALQRARVAAGAAHGLVPSAVTIGGDTNSQNPLFLGCFDDKKYPPRRNLGQHADLRTTMTFFGPSLDLRFGTVGYDDNGGTLQWLVEGNKIEDEIAAHHPQLAVLMFGTIDLSYGGDANLVRGHFFRQEAQQMWDAVDRFLAHDVIPIVTSIPSRRDQLPQMDHLTVTLNGVFRAVAQARQVPFLDYYEALRPLATAGVAEPPNGNGLHPTRATFDTVAQCTLTDQNLQYGAQMHNLVALEELDRVRRYVLGDEPAPDGNQTSLTGAGSKTDPLHIDALPFVDLTDFHAVTAENSSHVLTRFAACGGVNTESGPERVYRLTVTAPVAVHALVLPRRGRDGCRDVVPDCLGIRDVQLHVLKNGDDERSCVQTNNTIIHGTLTPGEWTFVVDAVDTPRDRDEVLFTIMQCNDGDPACATPL